jgi:hypothetical protein
VNRESGKGASKEGIGQREGKAIEQGPLYKSHNYIVFWELGILMNSLILKEGVCGYAKSKVSILYRFPYNSKVIY